LKSIFEQYLEREEVVTAYSDADGEVKKENAKKEEMLKEEDENEKRILAGSRKITSVIRGNKLNLEKVPKTQQRKSLISTEFKFLLGKDSFGTKDLRRQRKEKKQKTIAIKGKLFLENQIDIDDLKNRENKTIKQQNVEKTIQKWIKLQKTIKEEITLEEVIIKQQKDDFKYLKDLFFQYYETKIKSRKQFYIIRKLEKNMKVDNPEFIVEKMEKAYF